MQEHKRIQLYVGLEEGGCVDVGAIKLDGFTLIATSELEALQAQNERLVAECDALAARIQTAERVEKIFSEMPELKFDDCLNLFADEIRNVEFLAGQKGYLQGYLDAIGDPDEIDKEYAAHRANIYAAKVRKGGEQ